MIIPASAAGPEVSRGFALDMSGTVYKRWSDCQITVWHGFEAGHLSFEVVRFLSPKHTSNYLFTVKEEKAETGSVSII
jgi:hypothetical protein